MGSAFVRKLVVLNMESRILTARPSPAHYRHNLHMFALFAAGARDLRKWTRVPFEKSTRHEVVIAFILSGISPILPVCEFCLGSKATDASANQPVLALDLVRWGL